jgi:hypothetical protein
MMRSAMVWILCIVVMADCATAGRFFPWPVLKDFWRVCFLVVMSCAIGLLTRFGRRGVIGPPNGRVALAVAIGFLVRGAINLWAAPTH